MATLKNWKGEGIDLEDQPFIKTVGYMKKVNHDEKSEKLSKKKRLTQQ